MDSDQMKLNREKAFITSQNRGSNSRGLTKKDVIEIKIRLSKGELQSTICKDFKVSGNTIACISSGKIWNRIIVPGFSIGSNSIKIGSKSKVSKLNEAKVLNIKIKILNGESLTNIAREYKIHPSTVYSIKTGHTWKHVGG